MSDNLKIQMLIGFIKKEGDNSSMVKNNVAETRKQKKIKNKTNTLVVPSSINQIPDNDIVRLHAVAIPLTLFRTETEKSDIRVHKDGSTLRCVQKMGFIIMNIKRVIYPVVFTLS